MALLRFTAAYRAAGFELTAGELPDHLAVLCEFAAAATGARAGPCSREHRAGLELLRIGAGRRAVAVAARRRRDPRASCPTPRRGTCSARWSWPAPGRPAEEVGLEPFAPPEYMGGRR